MRRIAANGRPIFERKPCSGPMVRFSSSSSTSAISNWRLPGVFDIEKSHLVQAKRR